MNDQKADPSLQDEDFQFEDYDKFESPDDTTVHHEDQVAAPPAEEFEKPFGDKKDHRKMIVIGIILVIVLGIGLNSLVNHVGGVKIPKENSTLASPKPEEQSAQAVSAAPAAPVMPVATPAPLSSDIDRLNDIIMAQQQSMTQMQTSINTLQESVGALNGSLTDLSSQMTDVLNKIPAKPVARQKPRPVMPLAPPRPVFSIRALVPGRAWLQSNDGQSITVIDGDTVPGYGSVQDIDLNAGQVVLSDGTIIGYNLTS